MTPAGLPEDRRRADRGSDFIRLADYPVPELRKAVLTAVLLVATLALFIYMVHEVLVGIIAGVVLGAYMIPFHRWLCRRLGRPRLAALLSISLVVGPLVVILVYSWIEVTTAASYLQENSHAIARRLTATLRRSAFTRGIAVEQDLARWVAGVAERSTDAVDELQEAIDEVTIGIAVFLFTLFFILTDHDRIASYVRARIPGRYRELADQIGWNVRAVIYGAMYGTFVTQFLKFVVVLAMNLAWQVPLAVVLAIVSFFIGFFPIVGSWAVYVPVGIYLMVWRGDVVGGLAMIGTGFLVNTMLLSMYVRPKLAAERSHVLNFYWMFIGLVTGAYTFGLVGIVIGPVLIAVLHAVVATLLGEAGLAGPRLADGKAGRGAAGGS